MATEPMSLAKSIDAADAAEAVACAHCGLEVPTGLIDPAAREQFCCSGCRSVYSIIRGCGLERYYRLAAEDDARRQRASVSGRSFAELDDPSFEAVHVRDLGDGTRCVELLLEGVHCNACAWLVERLPSLVPAVIEARLELRSTTVRLRWDPRLGPLSAAARTLDSLGYTPHVVRDSAARELRRREDRKLLIRIGAAGAIAGNVMLMAVCLYGGLFTGIDRTLEQMFRWASTALGLLALAWPGSVFFRGAIASIRARAAHLDLPIAIGLAAGAVAGSINTLLGRGEIYFDSLCVLVFLLLVGRWIQRRQQRQAADALQLLYTVTPDSARLVTGHGVDEVPIESVLPGAIVEVLSGQTAPVDGLVVSGASAVDQSLLTGESAPRDVTVGDEVCAGAVNVTAPIRIRCVAGGEQTRVAKLMRLVERSANESAPIVRMADRLAGRFTLVMITLAAATFAAWMFIDAGRAIDNATALLIVACPCALGLATPLTMTVAIGRAARRGILIKGGEALETLAARGTIFLDKTGTLTEGRAKLVEWHGDEAARPLVAALERHSAHPVGRALADALSCAPRIETVDIIATAGAGIAGRVGERDVAVGSRRFLESRGNNIAKTVDDWALAALRRGHTPIFVAVDGEAVAVAELGDPLRPDSRDAVDRLRRLGWDVRLLSGDHGRIAAAVGGLLGLADGAATGDATPEDKLDYVRRAATRGPVIMVGDGVNDAAALRAATIGVAVHGGAEASLASASVYLNRPGLMPIVELLEAGRRVVRVIRANLGASLTYNLVAASLAATGVIHPLIAAILMPLSSLTAVSIALAGRSFGGRA